MLKLSTALVTFAIIATLVIIFGSAYLFASGVVWYIERWERRATPMPEIPAEPDPEPQQLALPAPRIAGLLPPARTRTLITPCTTSNRVLITPPPFQPTVMVAAVDLAKLTVKQLQALAKDRGIPYSRRKKADLVEALAIP